MALDASIECLVLRLVSRCKRRRGKGRPPAMDVGARRRHRQSRGSTNATEKLVAGMIPYRCRRVTCAWPVSALLRLDQPLKFRLRLRITYKYGSERGWRMGTTLQVAHLQPLQAGPPRHGRRERAVSLPFCSDQHALAWRSLQGRVRADRGPEVQGRPVPHFVPRRATRNPSSEGRGSMFPSRGSRNLRR